jgi:hypothetical protein
MREARYAAAKTLLKQFQWRLMREARYAAAETMDGASLA